MGFPCTGNVVSTFFLEDVFCAVGLIVAFGMNGDKDAALLHFSLITLGFVLRDAQSDQGSGQATDSGTNGSASERRHNWSGSNEWAQARYGQCTNTGQQSNRASNDSSCTGDDRRTFGHLCCLFVSEISGASLIGE